MDITDTNLQQMLSKQSSRVELWKSFIKTLDVKTMVEVGVWKGDFAQPILQACESIECYYMVDPWANLPDWNKPFNVTKEVFKEVYEEAMRKTEFADSKRNVLRGRTQEVVSKIPDDSLDFAYIDGDHTLRGITNDLIRIYPKVKEGGFIGGDDFVKNTWQHSHNFEPTLVCPFGVYFAEAMDVPVMALGLSQFLIQKTSKLSFSFIDLTNHYSDLSLNALSNKQTLASRGKRAIKKMLSSRRQ